MILLDIIAGGATLVFKCIALAALAVLACSLLWLCTTGIR